MILLNVVGNISSLLALYHIILNIKKQNIRIKIQLNGFNIMTSFCFTRIKTIYLSFILKKITKHIYSKRLTLLN